MPYLHLYCFYELFFYQKVQDGLISKGKESTARDILNNLRGSVNEVKKELKEIKDGNAKEGNGGFVMSKWVRPALIIGIEFSAYFNK